MPKRVRAFLVASLSIVLLALAGYLLFDYWKKKNDELYNLPAVEAPNTDIEQFGKWLQEEYWRKSNANSLYPVTEFVWRLPPKLRTDSLEKFRDEMKKFRGAPKPSTDLIYRRAEVHGIFGRVAFSRSAASTKEVYIYCMKKGEKWYVLGDWLFDLRQITWCDFFSLFIPYVDEWSLYFESERDASKEREEQIIQAFETWKEIAMSGKERCNGTHRDCSNCPLKDRRGYCPGHECYYDLEDLMLFIIGETNFINLRKYIQAHFASRYSLTLEVGDEFIKSYRETPFKQQPNPLPEPPLWRLKWCAWGYEEFTKRFCEIGVPKK